MVKMNKTKFLTIRIDEKDLQLIHKAADKKDVTLSKFIREALRMHAGVTLAYKGGVTHAAMPNGLGGVDCGETTENKDDSTNE